MANAINFQNYMSWENYFSNLRVVDYLKENRIIMQNINYRKSDKLHGPFGLRGIYYVKYKLVYLVWVHEWMKLKYNDPRCVEFLNQDKTKK